MNDDMTTTDRIKKNDLNTIDQLLARVAISGDAQRGQAIAALGYLAQQHRLHIDTALITTKLLAISLEDDLEIRCRAISALGRLADHHPQGTRSQIG